MRSRGRARRRATADGGGVVVPRDHRNDPRISSAEEFVRLCNSDDDEDLRQARLAAAETEIWLDVLNYYPDEREALTANKTLPDTVLRMLAWDSSPRIRQFLAQKHRLPPDVMVQLATDQDESVRGMLVWNRKLTSEALDVLADDPSPWVRACVAERRGVPFDEVPEEDPVDDAPAVSTVPPLDPATAARLRVRWGERWPGATLMGHLLREALPDTWVRFHSLPWSVRHPEDEAGYVELVRRHRAVIRSLAGDGPGRPDAVLVLSQSWSYDDFPAESAVPVLDPAMDGFLLHPRYWTSLREDPDPECPENGPSWTHLFIDELEIDSLEFEQLLRFVADGNQPALLITDAELSWLCAPYDGGVDVFAATAEQRDSLRVTHAGWLSPYPGGM